jgi:peptide/nickel transport system permease protein
VTLAGPLPVPAPAGAPVESGARAERGDPDGSPGRRTLMSSLWHNSNGRTGCVLVGLVLLAAIAGAIGITPYPAQAQDPTAVLKSPSFSHLLGTDQFGRDLFSLVLQGLYISVKIACVAVAIAGVIGTVAGIVAGYLGRWTASVIMRATDMLFAIPGIGYRPIFVRVVRGPVLALREAGYVRAGRVLGFSRRRLLFRHILPNVAGTVAVQTSLALAWSVLAEASLSFLGLGPPPPTASLGEMVSQSSSLAGTAWWTLAAPSVAIVIAVIGFNFLGDGLRDAIDPRARVR